MHLCTFYNVKLRGLSKGRFLILYIFLITLITYLPLPANPYTVSVGIPTIVFLKNLQA